jgi:hypothetical protein
LLTSSWQNWKQQLPDKYLTIVTAHNIDLSETITFGDDISLQKLPDWILSHEWLKRLSSNEQELVQDCKNAFVTEYPCSTLGEPDQRWPNNKSKQLAKYELVCLANLTLWLANPTPATVGLVFHSYKTDGTWEVQQSRKASRLLCHPDDSERRLTQREILMASALHKQLAALHIEGGWTPASAAWSALQTNSELIRYLLMWIALEALFGPDDGREMTFRLAQRIGLFLGSDRAEAQKMFAKAKKGYALRSKVAHGRWKYSPDTTERMAECEQMLRHSLLKLLPDNSLMEIFLGNTREEYLDRLAFG